VAGLAASISGTSLVFGLVAVVVFWLAIQLCWSTRGKPWPNVLLRLIVAVVLVAVGVVMIFFTAFGNSGR
jgi:amino acid transporter